MIAPPANELERASVTKIRCLNHNRCGDMMSTFKEQVHFFHAYGKFISLQVFN